MFFCDKQIAVLIPSLNPDDNLPRVIESFREKCNNPIIIVDDGSKEECQKIFSVVSKKFPDVVVLHHAVNLGKGRACKTGFNYYLNTYPSGTGVVTCDADGQHGTDDILQAIRELTAAPASLILGCRDFTKSNVPWKSSFGNQITKFFFALCTRRFLSDTQTGLRGIPVAFMRQLMNVSGERFEFETHMLLEGVASKIPFREYPIETIYINSNRATHFHPVRDSLKIYLTIIQYTFSMIFLFLCSGLFSAIIDVAFFYFFFHTVFNTLTQNWQLAWALICSRGISLTVNYLLNRNGVFKNQRVKKRKTFPLFISLCIFVLILAYIFNRMGQYLLPEVEPTVIKTAVDILLFLFNFFIQKTFIFCNQKKQ